MDITLSHNLVSEFQAKNDKQEIGFTTLILQVSGYSLTLTNINIVWSLAVITVTMSLNYTTTGTNESYNQCKCVYYWGEPDSYIISCSLKSFIQEDIVVDT